MNLFIPSLEVDELAAASQPKSWTWDGYLSPGMITLFTAMWKSGKTTLLSHLLAQRKTGGALAGQPVSAGVSAIVSEEPASRWQERHLALHFGPGNKFFCRPFRAVPTPAEWQELLALIKKLKAERGVDLAVIDTLASFLPAREEDHSKVLTDGLMPLRALADEGIAVLLLHHPRKAPSAAGMAARGGGMLPAAVDVILEMHLVKPEDAADRRRRLVAFSRDPATPRSLLIELNADASAYALVTRKPEDDAEFNTSWQPLRLVLAAAKHELTRQEILEQWPDTFPAPAPNTLWRLLSLAHEHGYVHFTGAGAPHDPYRYYLPEKQIQWQNDPMYQFHLRTRESADLLNKLRVW